jgi:hypothetical protein
LYIHINTDLFETIQISPDITMNQTGRHCRGQSAELNNYCAAASPGEQAIQESVMTTEAILPRTLANNNMIQGHCRAQSVELAQYCASHGDSVKGEERHGDKQTGDKEAEQLKLEEEWGGCCDEPVTQEDVVGRGEPELSVILDTTC